MMVPHIKNILYASDLSDNSIPALAWAMMLANQHDAQITFLHVIEEVSPSTTATIQAFIGDMSWQQMNEKQYAAVEAKVKDRIEQFCDRVKAEMDSCPFAVREIAVHRGVPVETILDEAESRKSDIIVMGTHGSGLLKDAMIGSTARRVVRRSQKPVFVIPLPETVA